MEGEIRRLKRLIRALGTKPVSRVEAASIGGGAGARRRGQERQRFLLEGQYQALVLDLLDQSISRSYCSATT